MLSTGSYIIVLVEELGRKLGTMGYPILNSISVTSRGYYHLEMKFSSACFESQSESRVGRSTADGLVASGSV